MSMYEQDLRKALEAGNYNVAPGSLLQGAALQVSDISPIMENVCFQDEHIILQKMIRSEKCKTNLVQFDRQLSYGIFGGSAALEGAVGQEETSEYVRAVVPIAYYVHIRRVSLAANMVETVDGIRAEDRAATDAARKIAGDIEFDLFRGKADFTTAGVFDGNPNFIPVSPNMLGLDPQIRQSDNQRTTQDAMFASYGSAASNVIPGGGTLTQANIQDAQVRSNLNMGNANRLIVDPVVLANYNKIAFGKERIVLANTPQDATGATLSRQWGFGGPVELVASRFLSGKTKPLQQRATSPNPPTTVTAASVTVAGVVTPFLTGQVYTYYVTSETEMGESAPTAPVSVTVAANGDELRLTITPPAGIVRSFSIYRTLAGGAAATAKFIGRIINNGGTTLFIDLGNKLPGFVTGYLVQGDTMAIKELAPYSRVPLAVTDLTKPEAHFRFCCLTVYQPRKNVLIDNLV